MEKPEALFGAAETCGRGEVLEERCRQVILAAVPPHLPRRALLFINIHPKRDPWGAVQAARRHGVDPTRLVLEISEQALLLESGHAIHSLRRCQRAGATVALDDVGRAFTGLPVLAMFPWDYFKIDRSLLTRAVRQSRDRTLLQCLAQFARRMGARTIAEGIENETELNLCRRIGVPWGQGFHLGRPQPLHGASAIRVMP